MKTNDILDYLAKIQSVTDRPTSEIVEQAEDAEPVQEQGEEQAATQPVSMPEIETGQWEEFQSPSEASYVARQYTPATPDVPSQTIFNEANIGDESYHPPVDTQGFKSKLESAFQQTTEEVARANEADLEWVKSKLETLPESQDAIDMRMRAQL